jgi:hypothetical protein
MSSYVYFGKRACRPSLGLLDFPWPMPSGGMMKKRVASNLTCAEQFAAEGLRQERAAGAAGTVQNHHRVPHDSGRITLRRADGPVVQVQRWKRLAGPEPEIADDEIAFDRGRKRRSLSRRRRGKTGPERDGQPEKNLHWGAP